MLNIYITRHGETKWNKESRLQGWKDSELTESGIRNAIALGERVYHTPFNAIYSSPSGRAQQTAKLLCLDRQVPILLDENLKEINFGEWEGKTQPEIEQKFKQEYFHFWNAPHLYNPELHKGESLEKLKLRVGKAINKIITANTDGNVLIVTHGVVIRALMSVFQDIPAERMWEPPFIVGTSLTVVKVDGDSFHVEMVGDTSHIKKD